jgi:hypothetical protein
VAGRALEVVGKVPRAVVVVAAGLFAFGLGVGAMTTFFAPSGGTPSSADGGRTNSDGQPSEVVPAKGDTTQTWAELSVLMGSAGMGDDAVEVAKRRVAAAEKEGGPKSVSAIDTRRELGLVLATLGRWPDAEAAYEQAVNDGRAGPGPDHPATTRAAAALQGVRVRYATAAVAGGMALLPAALDPKPKVR